jgi:hypothetical protein
MSTVYRYLVAFYASRPISTYQKECRKVVGNMDNNPYFPAPTPSLKQISADLDQLEQAELAAHGGPRGAVAARDVALVTVRADMRQLRSYIQAVSDADLTHAKDIIESSGMYLAYLGGAGKQLLAIRYGKSSGLATLVAKAAPIRAMYHWQVSEDGTDYRDLPPTLVSSTSVDGLTPAKIYHFRFRTFTRDGFSAWSPAVSFIAH